MLNCLQAAAWDVYKNLKKLTRSIRFSDPFLDPINTFLEICANAEQQMPEPNVGYVEFSVASASIIELANKIDQIIQSDPSLREDVSDENLATGSAFNMMAAAAARCR